MTEKKENYVSLTENPTITIDQDNTEIEINFSLQVKRFTILSILFNVGKNEYGSMKISFQDYNNSSSDLCAIVLTLYRFEPNHSSNLAIRGKEIQEPPAKVKVFLHSKPPPEKSFSFIIIYKVEG